MNKPCPNPVAQPDWAGVVDQLSARLASIDGAPVGDGGLGEITAFGALVSAFAAANANAMAMATATATASVNIDLDDDAVVAPTCAYLKTNRTLIALSRTVEWKSFTFQSPTIDVIAKCDGILVYTQNEGVFFRCLDGEFVPTPTLAAAPVLPSQLEFDGTPIEEARVTCRKAA